MARSKRPKAAGCASPSRMSFVAHLDTLLFRFINQDLANPLYDEVMPLISANAVFFPLVFLMVMVIIFQGGTRALTLAVVTAAAVLIASNFVVYPIKEFIMRPRPAMVLEGVRLFGSNGIGLAMPSGHATSWGTMAMVAWLFHRSSWKFMVPCALLVAFSRVYLGVHYVSDVIAGLLVGAATGYLVVTGGDLLWNTVGRRFFPIWWARFPSVLAERSAAVPEPSPEDVSRTWRNASWLLLGVLFIIRLAYIAGDTISLGEDEAYQWMWSQRLDWAYYSKPPMIAWVQWLGTHLWGDTAFGVRFFSPVLALVFGILVWQFLRRRTDERTAFWALVMFAATPLFAVGSTLLTVDAPTVFFYTGSLLAVWTAMERDSTAWWAGAGVLMALGFLSKFFSPFLWVGWVLFLLWTPEFRRQLRRPGPWIALALNLLGAVPVLVWNASHGWITLTHLQERGGLDHAASFSFATLGTFLGSIAGLLNPVFFIAVLVAIWGFIRLKEKPALWRFLFCASVPVFVFYLILACRAKAQPNWIGPAAPALFLFAVVWWHHRSRETGRAPRRWITAGLIVGLPVVIFLHDTNLLHRVFGTNLSVQTDPLNRVRGGEDLARIVQEQRELLAREGPPVFVIADHYGRASLINFYTPEARALLPEEQLAYVLSTDKPQNQYWFWPDYTQRSGQNAIYVANAATERKAPKRLRGEFESVKNLGTFKVRHKDKVCGQVQLFACRGKTPVITTSNTQLTSQP